MGMTEREKHLEVLENLYESMKIYPSIMLSTERLMALEFAISSIRTDLDKELAHIEKQKQNKTTGQEQSNADNYN